MLGSGIQVARRSRAGAFGLPFIIEPLEPRRLFAAVTPVVRAAPPGTLAVVASSPISESSARIDGDLVAYERISTHEIGYRNLASGEGGVISKGLLDNDLLPDVSGNKVVFMRDQAPDSRIALYDPSSGGAPVELSPINYPRRVVPSIGGTTVVWEDFNSYGSPPLPPPYPPFQQFADLVVYDLNTGMRTVLTQNVDFKVNPDVSPDGAMIAWLQYPYFTGGAWKEVWLANKSGGVWQTNLTQISGNINVVHTDGKTITYDFMRNGQFKVDWVAPAGGEISELNLPGNQWFPAISHGIIGFTQNDAPYSLGNSDVRVYDPMTNSVYKITDTPDLRETFCDLSVSDDGLVRVVWSAVGPVPDMDSNLYAYTFRLPRLNAAERIRGLRELTDQLVEDGSINGGQGNELTNPLESALKLISSDRWDKATQMLDVFTNKIDARIKALNPKTGNYDEILLKLQQMRTEAASLVEELAS